MSTQQICIVLTSVTIGIIGVGLNKYFDQTPLSTCHVRYKSPEEYMATKSPYIYPNKLSSDEHLNNNIETSSALPLGCQAEQIWMMVRHGTRNPSIKVINKMKTVLPSVRDQIVENHKNGKGELCEKEVSDLVEWKTPNLEEWEEKHLVPQGELELFGIGQRFQGRFPNLFPTKFDNNTFKFKYTKTQRAEASAKSFAAGIFGKGSVNDVWYPEALTADPVLRFYKSCPKWIHEVDKNAEAYKERVLFEESETFRATVRNVQKRCGFDNKDLTLNEIEIMYLSCSFETSWNPDIISPWCGVFDETDLQVLEYRQDIEYYWIDGYGFEITYKQACPPVRDFMEHFANKVKRPDSGPSVIAYFTHSGTTLKLLARLGLFKDLHQLRNDNYQTNRKWRTSIIDKFATNLALVLYKCPDSYNVGAFFQEQPIVLPACGGKWMCTMDELKSTLDSIINDCDVAKMCKM